MRQRLREQRREREARLLDLGALVYELHRQGKRAPELLQSKAAELELIDSEVRELEAQLSGEPGALPEQVADEQEAAEPEAAEEEPGAPEPEAPEPDAQEADTQEADALDPEEGRSE
jgi:hypothetical protein